MAIFNAIFDTLGVLMPRAYIYRQPDAPEQNTYAGRAAQIGGPIVPADVNPVTGFSLHGPVSSTGVGTTMDDSWLHASVGFYWFNRIHVSPSYFDLGNIVGDQLYTISVWNSYGHNQPLSTLSTVGMDGIELEGPATPSVMNAYEEYLYTLQVKTDGPPVVAASVSWQFDNPEVIDPQITLEGRRLLLWPFMPQWPIDESFEWKTDVQRTYSKVTRTSLLDTPRKALGFTYQLTHEQQLEAQRLARTWGYRPFGVPDFSQFQEIGVVAAGAQQVALDTAIMDVAPGDLLVVYEDWEQTEIVQVDTVTDGLVVFKKPTVASYTRAAVCPLFSGDARQGINFSQRAGGMAVVSAEFHTALANDLRTEEDELHHGIPLFPWANETAGAKSEGSRWAVNILDNGTGIPVIRAMEEHPVYRTDVVRTALTAQELMELKQWLHNRAGRRKAFALPSFTNDYPLAGPIGGGSYALLLGTAAYGQMYDKGALQLLLTDGTVYDLTVTATSIADNTTGVSVSQQFDRDIYPEEVVRISLVRKMVLASDKVRIKHEIGGRQLSFKAEEVPW